jgi:hypothetical protein
MEYTDRINTIEHFLYLKQTLTAYTIIIVFCLQCFYDFMFYGTSAIVHKKNFFPETYTIQI